MQQKLWKSEGIIIFKKSLSCLWRMEWERIGKRLKSRQKVGGRKEGRKKGRERERKKERKWNRVPLKLSSFCLKAIGVFKHSEHELPILLAWLPANKLLFSCKHLLSEFDFLCCRHMSSCCVIEEGRRKGRKERREGGKGKKKEGKGYLVD